jgi:hypothetical protein
MSYIKQALQRYMRQNFHNKTAADSSLDVLQSLSFVDDSNTSIYIKLAAHIVAEIEDQDDPNPRIALEVKGPLMREAFKSLYKEQGISGLSQVLAPMKGLKIPPIYYTTFNHIFKGQETTKSPEMLLFDAENLFWNFVAKKGKMQPLSVVILPKILRDIVKGMCNELDIPLENLNIKLNRSTSPAGSYMEQVYLNGTMVYEEATFHLYDPLKIKTHPDYQVYKAQGEPLPRTFTMLGQVFENKKTFVKNWTQYRMLAYRPDAQKIMQDWRNGPFSYHRLKYHIAFRNEISTKTPFKSFRKQFWDRMQKEDETMYQDWIQLSRSRTHASKPPEMVQWFYKVYKKSFQNLCKRTWNKLGLTGIVGPYEHDKQLEDVFGKAIMNGYLQPEFVVAACVVQMLQNCLIKEHKMTPAEVQKHIL